jgi:hypothetical protein
MKMSGIKARQTAARRAKVEAVWEEFKSRDLSFSYKYFLVVFAEMFGKAGQPTKNQLKLDLNAVVGHVFTLQAPVSGIDYRNSMSWMGAIKETIYYHKSFAIVRDDIDWEEE